MRLDTTLDPWFWGNIVLGGFIGSTTDGLSGAVNQYSPAQFMVTLQPSGSTAFEGKTSLTENQKAKDFIVVGYREIIGDLQKGQGQYLTSLLGLLKVPAEGTDQAIKRIRALSEAYPSIPEFADHVIEAYLPNGESKAETIPVANNALPSKADLVDFLKGLKKGTLVTFKYRHGDEATLEFITYDGIKGEIWVKQPGTNFLHDNIVDVHNVIEVHIAEIKK